MSKPISRRTFLGTTAALAAGAGVVTRPSQVRAANPGPNETVNVGLVGCGSRGPYVSYVFQLTPGVNLTAVCDVHAEHLAGAAKQGEAVSGKRPKTYSDYRKLIEDRDVDAVIVATPSHWHVLPAIDACAAGKDVYLEKPVGTSIGEGRAAATAAHRHKRIIQMGTQQHSWEHYQRAVELIRNGHIGEISHVHVWDVGNAYPGFGSPPNQDKPAELDWDFWLGPAPERAYNPNRFKHHYWFFDYGGAWQVAWGAHHYDVVHWAMDVRAPVAATGAGGKFAFLDDNREWPDTFNGTCEYAPGPVAKKGFLMSYTCRDGCDQPIMGRWHGKAFYGTDGVLVIDRTGLEILPQVRDDKKVVPEQKMASTKKEHDVVQDHVRGFIECVRTRKTPAADIEVGHRAVVPGHLMNIAWRTGRRVEWDADKERITSDGDANKWLSRTYRKPWALPA